MHERLRQQQFGTFDTDGATQGLVGQCLGIVVRATLDERTDQISGGFAHHPDFTKIGYGRKSAGGRGGRRPLALYFLAMAVNSTLAPLAKAETPTAARLGKAAAASK